MDTLTKLLDKARDACSPSNDSALARKLRVKPSAISNYRTGVSLPKPALAERLARIAGEDPAPWVLMIEAERAAERSPDDAATWSRIAKRLAAAAGILMLAVVAAPQQSIAQPGTSGYEMRAGYTLCAMAQRFMARLLRRKSRARIAAWNYRHPAALMAA